MLTDAEEFLKQSRERHRALKTFQATVAFEIFTYALEQWIRSVTWRRTIVYAAPNRFRVEHLTQSYRVLLLCDGKEYTVRNSIAEPFPVLKLPVPASIATKELLEGHPHYGGSALFSFFGSPQELQKLWGTTPPRFDADTTIQGEPCKTVVLSGDTYFKERRVWISTRDGLIRQLEGSDPGRPKTPVEWQTAQEAMASYKADPSWASRTAQEKLMVEREVLKPNTNPSRTVETFSNIVVNQPLPSSTFIVPYTAKEKARLEADATYEQTGIRQKIGEVVPDFKATTLATGKPLKLSSLRGHVVLIDVWATWCKPCVKGLPETLQIQKDYAKKGLVVLAISNQEPQKVNAFLKTHPQLKGLNVVIAEEINQHFGITGIPVTIVLGRDGKLVESFMGLQDPKTLRRALAQAGL